MPQKPVDSAEYQRQQTLSKDERGMGARDKVAQNIHEQNVREGKNTTFDQAQREATRIANKIHREDQEHGRR